MNATSAVPEQICEEPRAYVADEFVTAREIAHVLASYGGEAPPTDWCIDWSRGIAGRSGELQITNDPVLAAIAARIEAVLGFGCSLAGPTVRFRRYVPGDFHPGHVDCYEIGGQHLIATALIYLTDTLRGGETTFPKALPQPLVIAVRKGRLALWFNYTPGGEAGRRSFHASRILQGGEKATLAYFVYAAMACSAREPAIAARLAEAV